MGAGQKYAVIYADPPWQYENAGVKGAAENHYPTMTMKELCAMPVKEIAASDSVLFLWATFPMLREALELCEAWGFKYRTVAFTWVKPNAESKGWRMGTGFWTRGNAEICLLAVRGHPKRVGTDVPQLIARPAWVHSRKPHEARERIVRLMGDVPRVELFARKTFEGWDAWGNQVESDNIFGEGE
jgi:N6-adenosine-specific RNA methylase IME4